MHAHTAQRTYHLLVAGELNGVERHGWRGERLHEELHGAAEALDGAEEGASVEAVKQEVFGDEAGRRGHHLKDVVRKQRQRRGVVERQQRQLQHVHVRGREVRGRGRSLARRSREGGEAAPRAAGGDARVTQLAAQRRDCSGWGSARGAHQRAGSGASVCGAPRARTPT